jgi:hypothetical protein
MLMKLPVMANVTNLTGSFHSDGVGTQSLSNELQLIHEILSDNTKWGAAFLDHDGLQPLLLLLSCLSPTVPSQIPQSIPSE